MEIKNNFINELYERKLIHNISNKNKLINCIKNNKLNIYCGYDLTYDSLHIGHLLSLTLLKRFYDNNNNIFILIGDSTSMIGDPSFKKKNRKKILKEEIEKFKNKITGQIKIFSEINEFKINIINNSEWFNKINLINFIYNIGDIFSIKKMINNKFIKDRINSKNNISFKEFSYIILQSYDFLKMYKNKNVKLQIGGSDQFSNINFGINLINKIYREDVYGITFPILTDKNGFKIGKSNKNKKNIIWLDKDKTTPYDIYQYIINIPDNKIFNFFKILTFRNLEYINNLEKNYNINNIIKIKKILANDIIKIIFNKKINNIHKINNYNISEEYIKEIIKIGINKIYIYKEIKLIDLLIKIKYAKSKNNAKNIIKIGSIKINKIKINDIKYEINEKNLIYNKYILINKGKKNYYIIIWKQKKKMKNIL